MTPYNDTRRFIYQQLDEAIEKDDIVNIDLGQYELLISMGVCIKLIGDPNVDSYVEIEVPAESTIAQFPITAMRDYTHVHGLEGSQTEKAVIRLLDKNIEQTIDAHCAVENAVNHLVRVY